MSTEKNSTPHVVGTVIGTLGQIGVTTWAALETSGALSVCCWILVALMAFGVVAKAAKA